MVGSYMGYKDEMKECLIRNSIVWIQVFTIKNNEYCSLACMLFRLNVEHMNLLRLVYRTSC